jgi:hypothetical protein
VECWLNLLGLAGAWFDVFLEGCARFQMRLLLPRAFFEFILGVSLYGAGLSFILSWGDFSFSQSSAVFFWYSLMLDQSESDGVRRVPSGWCQQCIGRLFGRLMESLLFLSFGLQLSWSGLHRTCLVGCGLCF